MTPSDQPESSEDTGSADNSEAVVDAESGAIDIDAIDAINIDEAEVAMTKRSAPRRMTRAEIKAADELLTALTTMPEVER